MLKVGSKFSNKMTRIENNTVPGYTIVTPGGTHWKILPRDYMLEGIIISVEKSFYQQDDNVNKIMVERISEKLWGKNLRKTFVIWQRVSNGNIIM